MDADLVDVKQMFSDMMRSVQPWTLSHFIMWLDLKIAEYKVLGYMVLDKKSAYDKDKSTVYRQFSRHNTSSPVSESSCEQMYDFPIQGKQPKQNRSPNITNDYTESENYTELVQHDKQKSVTNAGTNEKTDDSWKFVKQKGQNQDCERQVSVSGSQESCENKIQNQRKPRKPGKVLHSIVNNLKQNSINNPLAGDSGTAVFKTGNQKYDLSEREVHSSDKTMDSASLEEKYKNNGMNIQNHQVMSSLTRRQEVPSGAIQDDRLSNKNTDISASQESAVFVEDNAPLYKSQQFSSLISLSKSRGRRRRSSNDEITYPVITTKDSEITQTYDEPTRSQNLADFYFAQNQLDEQFAVRRVKQNACKMTSRHSNENDDPLRNNQSEQNHNSNSITPSKYDNGSKILKDVSVKQEVASPVRDENNSPKNYEIEREKTPKPVDRSMPNQFIDNGNHSSMSKTGNEMVVNGNNRPVVVKSEPNNDEEYSCSSTTGNDYNQSYSSDGDTTSYKDISTHFEYHGDDIADESYMQNNSELYGEDSSNDVLQGAPGMDQHDNKIKRQRSYKKRQSESMPNQVPRDASSGKFVCELCSKTFTNRSSYFRHKRIHGEKKYRCFVCDKAFHRKEHLQSHIHRHTKSFPLKCCKCSYESHSLDEANTHFQDNHSHLEPESTH
ncbi:early growth response factor homolog 1-like [Mytilus californianus]|uniref:early growth response factor homolog 1-like n=1 Tax=Mytilus californianus TaxID=6549 RepID=UPI0022463DA0|nr:early growth response factor homolog 1-like [Mytilus californianus]